MVQKEEAEAEELPFDPRESTLTNIPILEAALRRGAHTLSDRQRFEILCQRIEDLTLNRMSALREEATTIEADMRALTLRLERDGSDVSLADVRTARWYRTAAQLRVAQHLLRLAYQLDGREDQVCYPPVIAEEESDGMVAEINGHQGSFLKR